MTRPNNDFITTGSSSPPSVARSTTASNPDIINVPHKETSHNSQSQSQLPSSFYPPSTSRIESRTLSSPTGAARALTNTSASVFAATPSDGALLPAMPSRLDDLRNLVQQAFVPHIAIHTSQDTIELTQEKGFKDGLWQLLRPYGERIQGKVTIRDSAGSNRSCDDYAVRFVQLDQSASNAPDVEKGSSVSSTRRVIGDIGAVERLVNKHLSHAEEHPEDNSEDYLNHKDTNLSIDRLSPFYALYMKRLLSGLPVEPHDTFTHPIACVIAISSRNPNPIDTLRQLYDDSSRGRRQLPLWMNQEFLRYYVLVHDEEKDDISKSTMLFEQMKRHFGLHCHLLRLRSSHCIITDDDAISFPTYGWLSASEELDIIRSREGDEDVASSQLCIYDSDATAIRTFIREMVAQSVIPSMERCVSTWNEQVASRRRGIGARISKLWTGFGGGATTATSSNYDAANAYYKPDAPEALMRKLADFAFMLRDWKLAQSTYDFCRSDYNNDKAWKYHAAANEMAVISALMVPQALSSRSRADTIDPMIETAIYSYVTRCSDSYGALRSLTLTMELLKLRGDSSTDDAARWGAKLLELRLTGPVGSALTKERIAACHASRKGTGSGAWGARTRKAALWNILAAHEWIGQRKFSQADSCMQNARALHQNMPYGDSLSNFGYANMFVAEIVRELEGRHCGINEKGYDHVQEVHQVEEEEESETLDATIPRTPGKKSGELHATASGTMGDGEKSDRDDTFV